MTEIEKQLFADEVVTKTIKKLNEYYFLTPRLVTYDASDVSQAVQSIFLTVCDVLKVKPEVALMEARFRESVYARQVTFFVCRHLLGRQVSLAKIGELLRPDAPFHHATVIYSVKNIHNLMQTNKTVRQQIDYIIDLVIKTKSNQLSKFKLNLK